MAIEIRNGVTLPDIPADVLASHPHVGIVEQIAIDGTVTYGFLAASEICYISAGLYGSLAGTYQAGIGTRSSYQKGSFSTGDSEWTIESGTMYVLYIGSNSGYQSMKLVWANGDVYEATSVDMSTGAYTKGDIYFLDSTVAFEEKYHVPGTWFKGMGDAVRKFTGVNKRYTPSEMLNELSFPNGMRWNKSNITGLSNTDELLHGCPAVAYANGIWVAVVYGVGTFYSHDGKTWTQASGGTTAIAFPKYVDGIWFLCNGGGLRASYDGKAWSKISNVYHQGGIIHANDLWVTGSNESGFFYSTDGLTLTQSNITNVNVQTILYEKGIWVGCGNDSTYYSTDGKTWVLSNITDGSMSDIKYANGIFIGFDTDSGVYYSIDGKTWTKSDVVCGFRNAIFKNGLWIGCSKDNGLYYSTDGKTWTQSNITDSTFYEIINENGIWVAGGYSSDAGGLYYSTDGKTWTQSNMTSGTVYDIEYANGIFIASLLTTSCYSTDGIAWIECEGIDDYITASNANGIWVAGGIDGIYYSVSWEPT